jgi:hypothetical protein
MTMTIKLRGGHAPGFVRELFCDSINGFAPTPWMAALDEDLGREYLQETKYSAWLGMSKLERARWITGALWNCCDTLPQNISDDVGLPRGSSYAQAARYLRATIGPLLVPNARTK